MRGQVASGPDAEAGRGAQANDTGEGRVGTQYRSRTRRDPRENTGTGRVGTQYTGYITSDETNDDQRTKCGGPRFGGERNTVVDLILVGVESKTHQIVLKTCEAQKES